MVSNVEKASFKPISNPFLDEKDFAPVCVRKDGRVIDGKPASLVEPQEETLLRVVI